MSIQTEIRFVVEYEDGRRAVLKIQGSELDHGDVVAVTIARERQRRGEIPEGKIRSIRRDPPG